MENSQVTSAKKQNWEVVADDAKFAFRAGYEAAKKDVATEVVDQTEEILMLDAINKETQKEVAHIKGKGSEFIKGLLWGWGSTLAGVVIGMVVIAVRSGHDA